MPIAPVVRLHREEPFVDGLPQAVHDARPVEVDPGGMACCNEWKEAPVPNTPAASRKCAGGRLRTADGPA